MKPSAVLLAVALAGILAVVRAASRDVFASNELRFGDDDELVLGEFARDVTWNRTVAMIRNQVYSSANYQANVGRTSKANKWFLPQFLQDLIQEAPICNICRTASSTLITLRRYGASKSTIRNVAVNLCNGFQIAPAAICEGMIDTNLDTVLYIIDQRPLLTADSFCGVLFQSERCRFFDAYGTLEWKVRIDETGARTPIESKRQVRGRSSDDLTIVHITDTHTDPLYVAGSLGACSEPVCCRDTNATISDPSQAAGFWGDYRSCDSPWQATINVFEQIKARHERIDFIYYTGDVVDHAIWRTSFEHNADTIVRTFHALKQVFGDVPVLPVIGNHEPHPVNQFAPLTQLRPGLETISMYNLLADTWSLWLPESAQRTVRLYGYYSVRVRPGLRVIGLNNNDGSTFNFWLLYDSRYMRQQLQWLHDQLLLAERAGEHVHLLVHFPNGHRDMFRTYSREYQRIVERFWDTISGQFNGHTHKDQFYVFYDRATSKVALNVAWNGGSATTYSNVNPNYRVYTVEPNTYQVANHQTWIYNLTEANANAERSPAWFEEYDFQQAYDLPDLSPASLDGLLTRMSRNAQLLERYWTYKVKMGDPSLAVGCDNDCMVEELCQLATTWADPLVRGARCEQLMMTFWQEVMGGQPDNGTPRQHNIFDD